MKPFGWELLLDLYDCKPETINDLRLCYDFLESVVKLLGVQKQSPPFIFQSPPEFKDKVGLSGWIPLIESGIQLHTLQAKNFVSIDYYTCSDYYRKTEKKLINFAKSVFKPKRLTPILLFRGTNYYK
jgi:S-adenosylmethionine/arginine decarboxylase-like enzyme